MIVLEIFEIMLKTAAFSILLMLCCTGCSRPGRNNERDELAQRRQACADHPIPMEHTHGGEDD